MLGHVSLPSIVHDISKAPYASGMKWPRPALGRRGQDTGVPMNWTCWRPTILTGVLLLMLLPRPVAATTVFSSPMSVPESIALVPETFGPYGGSYFVPDADTRNVWVVPHSGGSPAELLPTPLPAQFNGPIGIVFLPATWGDGFAGQVVVFEQGVIHAIASDTSVSLMESQDAAFSDGLLGPSGFGAHAGRLLVTDQNGLIWSFGPSGSVEQLVGPTPALRSAFGIVAAPAGFGSLEGQLLVSRGESGDILAVGADGSVSPFAAVPLDPGQNGLRQMAFAPPDFLAGIGIPGEVLLVSVSGSRNGHGRLGSLLALDSSGSIVAHLVVAGVLDKFDPRGMLFTDGGDLLISDTSDPILIAGSSDFARGPESVPAPSGLAMMLLGALLCFGTRSAVVRDSSESLEPFRPRSGL